MGEGDLDGVLERLALGDSPQAPTHLGIPVLFEALRSNVLEVIDAFDRAGADWSTPYNEGGFTPLIYASLHCALPTVRWLLEHGQAVTQTTRTGVGVMHVAVQRERTDVARHLREQGADPFAATAQGELPLLISLKSKGGLAMFHFMLSCYAGAGRSLDAELLPCMALLFDRQEADAVERMQALLSHAARLPDQADLRAYMAVPGNAPSQSFRPLEQTLASRRSSALFALLKAERISRAAAPMLDVAPLWQGDAGL